MRITNDFPRIKAWVGRVDDLSGLEVGNDDWLAPGVALERLAPLLAEIGRTYVPALLANAAALDAGEKTFSTQIDGRPWEQPSFPYQGKCLLALRDAHDKLPADAAAQLEAPLKISGCAALFT